MKKPTKASIKELEEKQSSVIEGLIRVAADRKAKKHILWNDSDAIKKVIASAQSEKTSAGVVFEVFQSQKICNYVKIFSDLLVLYGTQLQSIQDRGEVNDSLSSFAEMMFTFEKAILADVEIFDEADKAYDYVNEDAQKILKFAANEGKKFRDLLRQQYDALYSYRYIDGIPD